MNILLSDLRPEVASLCRRLVVSTGLANPDFYVGAWPDVDAWYIDSPNAPDTALLPLDLQAGRSLALLAIAVLSTGITGDTLLTEEEAATLTNLPVFVKWPSGWWGIAHKGNSALYMIKAENEPEALRTILLLLGGPK